MTKRIRNKPEAFTLTEIDRVLEGARWTPPPAPQRSEERAERGLPPLLTGGESPISLPGVAARLVLDDGKVLEIPARRGWGGDAAIVDWLNFTVHESAFSVRKVGITDEEVITEASFVLNQIFGLGITSQRPIGMNFYQRSYVIGDDVGFVCHGGQRDTVQVTLSGSALAAASPGWEGRAVEFFTKARAKITRCDLAYDDFDGETDVDQADRWFDEGLFCCGGRMPNVEHRGNWKRPSGKGRTLYVGSRSSGKFCRVYEKGRQLGDSSSPWVRFEVEFKSSDCELPYEMLLQPGAYLAAAYPAFAWISKVQRRIESIQRAAKISYEAICEWLHRQCGAALWVVSQIEGSADAALAKLQREGVFPKRLRVPATARFGDYLHEREPISQPADMAYAF